MSTERSELLVKSAFEENLKKQIKERLRDVPRPIVVDLALIELGKIRTISRGKYAEANVNAVFLHKDPLHFALILRRLHGKKLFDGENAQFIFDAACKHQEDAKEIARALRKKLPVEKIFALESQTLLQKEAAVGSAKPQAQDSAIIRGTSLVVTLVYTLITFPERGKLVSTLYDYYQMGMLSLDSAKAITNIHAAKDNSSSDVTLVLTILEVAGLLTEKNTTIVKEAIKDSSSQSVVESALLVLLKTGLLLNNKGQSNFEIMFSKIGHQLYPLALTLERLLEMGLLSGENKQENFEAIIQHKDPYEVSRACP